MLPWHKLLQAPQALVPALVLLVRVLLVRVLPVLLALLALLPQVLLPQVPLPQVLLQVRWQLLLPLLPLLQLALLPAIPVLLPATKLMRCPKAASCTRWLFFALLPDGLCVLLLSLLRCCLPLVLSMRRLRLMGSRVI